MTHTRHNVFRKPKRGRCTPDPASRTRHERLRQHHARLRARDKRDQKDLENRLDNALSKDD